jgi:hypothetical protein
MAQNNAIVRRRQPFAQHQAGGPPFSVVRSCLFSVHNTSAHDLRTRYAVLTGCYCEKEEDCTAEQSHYFTKLFNSKNFTASHCRFCSVEHLSLFLSVFPKLSFIVITVRKRTQFQSLIFKSTSQRTSQFM